MQMAQMGPGSVRLFRPSNEWRHFLDVTTRFRALQHRNFQLFFRQGNYFFDWDVDASPRRSCASVYR